ncbi:MAG: T9SS type A sorting domain-containing protein [Bacteroidia bacterium]
MKKLLFVFALLTCSFYSSKAQFSFTITNQSSSYSITCTNTIINLYVTASTTNSIQCDWFSSSSNSVTGNPQSFNSTGSFTVIVKDLITNSVSAQQFSIYQNTVTPSNSVSPITQTINCASPSANFTSTANSPASNYTQNWYSSFSTYPNGPVSSSTNFSLSIYNAQAVGTHTAEICDLINGCCTTKTVLVTSASAFPTFQSFSIPNYILGCASSSQPTLCCGNATSSNGPVQFAFLPPGSLLSIPIPSTAFGAQSCTNANIPGTWTLVVQDPINGCQSAMSVIMTQNTTAPNVSYAMNTKTLTCYTPTVIATGSSTTSNTQISWLVPATPSLVNNPAVIIGAPNGPTTSPTATVYANYTVVATNTLNSCKTSSVILINQNFRAPTPQLALGNPSILNCIDTAVVISFTNLAVNSGVPGALAIIDLWAGPNQSSTVSATSYTAYSPGIYTLTVHDSYNGCTGIKTVVIYSNTNGCVGIEKNYLEASGIKILPNPANDYILLQTEDASEKLKLEIFDVQGKLLVQEFNILPGTIVKLNLEKGLYLYQVTEKNKVVKRNKLVID